MTLETRLKRMEQAAAVTQKQAERRVIRIIAGENDGQAAYALARANGFDPDDDESNDLIILHTIKTMPGKPPYSEPPRVMLAHLCRHD